MALDERKGILSHHISSSHAPYVDLQVGFGVAEVPVQFNNKPCWCAALQGSLQSRMYSRVRNDRRQLVAGRQLPCRCLSQFADRSLCIAVTDASRARSLLMDFTSENADSLHQCRKCKGRFVRAQLEWFADTNPEKAGGFLCMTCQAVYNAQGRNSAIRSSGKTSLLPPDNNHTDRHASSLSSGSSANGCTDTCGIPR